MKQESKDYKRVNEKGSFAVVVKVSIALIICGIYLGAIGWTMGWCGEPTKVVNEESGPRAMLDKYEWFKELSAQLDKKQSDIEIVKLRIVALSAFHKNTPLYMWPQKDREQVNVWLSEIAGLKAGFNELATQYNSENTKFNYRFVNVDELPKGAEKSLPKEYKLYITE